MAAVVAIHNAGEGGASLLLAGAPGLFRRCRAATASVPCPACVRLCACTHMQPWAGCPAPPRPTPPARPAPPAVNERAWREIQRWEEIKGVACKCGGPRLVKFRCGARPLAAARPALAPALPLASRRAHPRHRRLSSAHAAVPTPDAPALPCATPCLPCPSPAGGGPRSTRPRRGCSTCWATACPLTGTTGWWTAAGRRSGEARAAVAGQLRGGGEWGLRGAGPPADASAVLAPFRPRAASPLLPLARRPCNPTQLHPCACGAAPSQVRD